MGIAFVPETGRGGSALTEQDKIKLMGQVSEQFKAKPFVDSIEIIPSAYLRKGGSFGNLSQLQSMYNVDVIALLAYDQEQFTDEGLASITYWTIVGAYLVPGEKNDTHTMIDATIYDIASQKLLFRAPGISHIKSKATPVNLSEQLREDRHRGMFLAAEDLNTNLALQLEVFKDKVRSKPEQYKIKRSAGYIGGGNLGLLFSLLLALFGASTWLRARR
ncbi:MAG: rhombotarget lipoprotein [Cellvibrionaceae bacterium]|nr:rhombotarget lipoprotein [Cellvibrionaceae bacterium]